MLCAARAPAFSPRPAAERTPFSILLKHTNLGYRGLDQQPLSNHRPLALLLILKEPTYVLLGKRPELGPQLSQALVSRDPYDRQAVKPRDMPGRGWLPGPGRQAGAARVRGREGMAQPPVTTGWRLSLDVCSLPAGGLPGALSWEPGWPQLSPGPDKAAKSALCEGKEAPSDKEGKSPDSIGLRGASAALAAPGSLQSWRQDAGGAVGRQRLRLSWFPS